MVFLKDFILKSWFCKKSTDNRKHALCDDDDDDDTPTTIQDINPNLEASAFVWFISHDLSKFCHLLQSQMQILKQHTL